MLYVSDNLRALIVSEFRYAVSQMRATQIIGDKLYFMTATGGMVQRIFNIEFDQELVFAHQVLTYAQSHIAGRLNSPRQGQMTSVMPPGLLEALEDDLEELANRWEKPEDIADILSHITLLGYSATGNGFYLFTKGQLSLERNAGGERT